MRFLPFVFLVLLIHVFPGEVAGQKIKKKYKFKRIEANSKLSNSNVTAIFQDSGGFLWVGTDDGLNRFDGYDFKIYRNIDGDSSSLLKNKVQAIFEDSSGRLWISTLNSGLHFYDRTHDTFSRVAEFSILHCQVMRIMEDNDHNIWIGGVLNSNSFVAKLDNQTGKWKQFLLFPSTDPVYSMLQISTDEFWLGTRLNGLFKWNKKTGALQQFKHDPKNSNSLPGDYIEELAIDAQGSIWIATRSGLSKLDSKTMTFVNYTAQPASAKPGLPVNDIMDICMDNSFLWIATENGGLSKMNMRTGTFENFDYDKNDPNSIINNSIWSLHKDKQGRIWIGSYSKGLCVLDSFEEKFAEVDVELDNNLVNAVLKDSKGRLWIGTEQGLVMQDKGITKYYKHDPKNPNSLSSNAVNCIYEDSKSRIWTGHWNGGINRLDENLNRFIRYAPDANRPEGLTNPNVFDIAETPENELLVCTFNGLYILKDEKKGVFENISVMRHEGDQLLLDACIDSKKNIWLGSYNGLNLLDREEKTYRQLFFAKDTTGVSDRVSCMLEDKKGRLWVGSFAGLHQMISPNEFASYTVKDGLPVNIVQGILEDPKGSLWLGTTHGLVHFNPETKIFTTYDESDGLVSSEFRRKAFFRANDGQLFVGGKGLNSFYPDSLSINPNKPSVFITDLKIFNKSVQPNDETEILKKSISHTDEITLDYKQTFFTLHYVGINFTASYKNQYAYKLDGFDPNWNYVDDLRFATFTNLNPGTYTFHVKAANNDGFWNEEGAKLVIHILPPWWKTIWFRSLVIGFGILIIISLYYARVNNISLQNIKLESLVDVRTKELQKINQELALREEKIKSQNEELMMQQLELAAQNEELIQGQEEASTHRDLLAEQNRKLEAANKIIESNNETLEQEVEKRTNELVEHNHQLEQFAFISAHNLRSPVARILGLGEVLKLQNLNQEERENIFNKLIFTTTELDRVVKDLNKILDVRKNNSTVITDVNLSDVMELVRANLQKEIEETGAQIEEDFYSIAIIQSVKPYMDSILMNLVSNAIKYRHPRRKPVIKVAAIKDNDNICISVSDNGLGIDLLKHEEKLFKLYNRFHLHVEGKGMGLYMVKTQVAALGGRIEVSGKVDMGLTFKIILQCREESILA